MNTLGIPITIEVDSELDEVLNEAVAQGNTTKTNFVRQAIIEKLEDMHDAKIADEAFKKWVDGGKKTYSHAEMMKRYG